MSILDNDDELRQDYRRWVIDCFKKWEILPHPDLERSPDAKRLRASYLGTARSVVQLCQPPEKMVRGKAISLDEFLTEYEAIASEVQDILSLLKDSADWAVSALDNETPYLPLHPQEVVRIQEVWDFDPHQSAYSPGLAIAFGGLSRRIRQTCPLNRRTRIALIRAEWAFSLSEKLVYFLKDGNPWEYVRGISRS